MGRTRNYLTDTRTFSIITSREVRIQLQAISVMTGRGGTVGPMVREILDRFIETYAAENRREFDLMVSNLMDQDGATEVAAAVIAEPA